MTSAPHAVTASWDADRLVTGPSCVMSIGARLVGFSYWSELPQEGAVWYATSAAWQESAGTDVTISVLARNSKGRWEQLRILHSLR